MKICCISDLHGTLPVLPTDVDLLLIAGDIACEETITKEKSWFKYYFNTWFLKYNIPSIYIGGNHDFYLNESKGKDVAGLYLENDSVVFAGIKIFGTPLSLEVGPWVWQATENDIYNTLRNVRCDILMSHGPAFGLGDKVNYPFNQSVGSTALYDWIHMYQPKLVVNGHIHPARGIYKLGETVIVNAAVTDDNLRNIGKVYCIDWDVADNRVLDISEYNGITSQYGGSLL